MKVSYWAAILGYVFECYNNVIYGFFAVSLAYVFFPQSSTLAPLISSFWAFAAGFLARPLGAGVFGYIADKYGRRQAIRTSIFLTSVPTLFIGLIPTYEMIGEYAFALVFISRLLQGLSVGGGYSSALTYIAEQNQSSRKIFFSCLLVASGFIGGVLGTLSGALFTSSFMPAWGWRLAFIAGGISGLLIYRLCRKMEETPYFEDMRKKGLLHNNPLSYAMKGHARQFISCVILGGTSLTPVYLATVYINSYFKEYLGFSQFDILRNNFWVLASGIPLVLVSSWFIKRFGEVVVMKVSMLWLGFLSIPAYALAFSHPTPLSLYILQAFIMLGDAPQVAALSLFLPKLFPTGARASGIGTSLSLGQALLGGTTPVIAAALVNHFHSETMTGVFLSVASLFYVFAIRWARTGRQEMVTPSPAERPAVASKAA